MRPKANIDFRQVDKYLQAHCSGAGIAAILGVHPNTLYAAVEAEKGVGFSAYKQMLQAGGNELLRAKMFSEAMAGNTTMAIFLSKQYLGMKNDPELEPVPTVD